MIQRFHEKVFQRMSPEARVRKLSIMRALAKSMRAKNKENENTLNNNRGVPLAISFKQSTPLKAPQITDLDDFDSDSDSENLTEDEMLEVSNIHEDNVLDEGFKNDDLGKQQSVITEICGSVRDCESIESQMMSEGTENEQEDLDTTVTNEYGDKNKFTWKSLELLHDNAEHEFYRSLEESKLYVSSASLLEEIEADLPSSYSLAKPFNYTFHTVSSYRTQARLARMVRSELPSNKEKEMNSTCPEFLKQEDGPKAKNLSNRIDYLEVKAMIQKALSDQAEKALNLSKIQKFLGVQHLESEKALLLANLRHEAAIKEMRKVKLSREVYNEGALGQITISDIVFTAEISAENPKEYFLCIVTERENVLSSSMITVELDGKLHFDEEFKFDKLERDFVIFLELYRLTVKEPKKAILKTALVNKLKRMAPVNTKRSITYSFHGKSSFVRVTSAELTLDHITKRENDNSVLLNPLSEHLAGISISGISMWVKTDIKANFKLSGFLNVFRQTWHRRWYILSGYFLESWQYPEDRDMEKAPVDIIYLPNCISATPVGTEVCIRPHCFALNLSSQEEKIVFSADSVTNMDQWVNNLNSIIENICAWRPNI